MHSAVALTTMWICASSPSPASLPDTMRLSSVRVAVVALPTKWGLPANATGTPSASELSASTIRSDRRCIRSSLDEFVRRLQSTFWAACLKRAADTRRRMRGDEALRIGPLHDFRPRGFGLRRDYCVYMLCLASVARCRLHDVFKSIARRFCEKITERQYERCQRGGTTLRPDFGRRRRRGFPRLRRRAPVPGGFPGDARFGNRRR